MVNFLVKFFQRKNMYLYELKVEYRKKDKNKSDYSIVTDVLAPSALDVISKSLLDYNEPKDGETMIFYVTKVD
jgi:hypothetical protein